MKRTPKVIVGALELAYRMGYIDRDDEIVRCKDCKHWQCDDSESYCDELGTFGTSPTSYCSFAKRKEEWTG